jgi:predicted dehydrogenase/threonine dehydrogenase-like Zn-dependent dehydrogenase
LRQVAQSLGSGTIEVLDVPAPLFGEHEALVAVRASLVSAGTERTKVRTANKSLLGKARARPDQVAAVIDKARADGLRQTLHAVRTRLSAPTSMGYSSAGVVIAVGARVSDLKPGDRVACGGSGYAVHAEINRVPGHLCVRLPPEVSFEEGAFATVGSIALHGVRQAQPTIGERGVVIGLGLVGQLAGQILRANGCATAGIDLDESMLEQARSAGAVDFAVNRNALDPARLAPELAGSDFVLITAATPSADPVTLAAALCRDRGRVVVLGDVGLDVPRAPYYDREIDLRLSRSYGPGRYDHSYEERGLDYPIGYVRWTERRNMAAFLGLVAGGSVRVASLIKRRMPLEEAPDALQRLGEDRTSPLGLLLTYPESTSTDVQRKASVSVGGPTSVERELASRFGLIGAGSFAQRVILPGLKAAGFELVGVASASGLSAAGVADGKVAQADTVESLLARDVGLIAIAARHSSHAELAEAALRSGKATYVEKPPCLTWEELFALHAARADTDRPLFVGFNRRYAPLLGKLEEAIASAAGPREIQIRVQAGRLPEGHWLNDVDDGGGRLLGEGCHFVDLACQLAGSLPERVQCAAVPESDLTLQAAQCFAVTLLFGDGSLAAVSYGDRAARGIPKESIEVHVAGVSASIDDFRSLTVVRDRRAKTVKARSQDKGHGGQFQAMRRQLAGERGERDPRALDPLDTMAVTLTALESARLGVSLSPEDFLDRG